MLPTQIRIFLLNPWTFQDVAFSPKQKRQRILVLRSTPEASRPLFIFMTLHFYNFVRANSNYYSFLQCAGSVVSVCFWAFRLPIWILPSISKKVQKNRWFKLFLWLHNDFLSLKTVGNVPTMGNKQNNFRKNLFFVGILKADEKSRIRILYPVYTTDTSSVADPDPGSGIGCFLTPGSGIRNRFFLDPGSRIPDLGSRIPRPYF